jgi:hypothetical protein
LDWLGCGLKVRPGNVYDFEICYPAIKIIVVAITDEDVVFKA